jgi:hypothetical protein
MPEAIVDLLKIVKIEKHQGKRISLALGASDLGFEMAVSKSPVIKTGQWVNQCEILPLG